MTRTALNKQRDLIGFSIQKNASLLRMPRWWACSVFEIGKGSTAPETQVLSLDATVTLAYAMKAMAIQMLYLNIFFPFNVML